jgi:hypothetical protein
MGLGNWEGEKYKNEGGRMRDEIGETRGEK